MADKTQAVGICDLCLGPIQPDNHYTRRGPRLHCSRECRNTANSRTGAPVRAEMARERVRDGTWYDPRSELTPERRHEIDSTNSRNNRLREIDAGRWRNPGLTSEARAANAEATRRRWQENRDAMMSEIRRRPIVDLRISKKRWMLHADLWPAGANVAEIAIDGDRILITPHTDPDTSLAHRFAGLRGTGRVRVRALTARRVQFAVGKSDSVQGEWHCVGRVSPLVFVRTS